MGAFGIWQWLVILAIVLILFARPGKISGIMGDLGKGLSKFKSGVKEGADDGMDVIEDAKPTVKQKSPTSRKATKKKARKKKAKR